MLPILLFNRLSIPLIAVYTTAVGYTNADHMTTDYTYPPTGRYPIELCCDYKTVGGVKYILAGKQDDNLNFTTDISHCMSGCVYEQQSYPRSRFCFNHGRFDVEYCGDVKVTCSPGTVGDGICCLPDNDGDGVAETTNTGNCTLSRTIDNCPEVPNSGQEDNDNDGDGDACDEDADGDDVENYFDNCPLNANPNQKDTDNDWIGDECDNCVSKANRDQKDTNHDGFGDACDPDIDSDGISNDKDNCPKTTNPGQEDTDGDGVGDACDNCKNKANADQADDNNNNVGNACDDGIDTDHDGIPDGADNCRTIPNADQLDTDSDGKGDVCDDDDDNDTIVDASDNCVLVANTDQADSDGDGVGDVCQNDCDGDGITDDEDVCRCDSSKSKTDFTGLVPHNVGSSGQGAPVWEFTDGGKQVRQKINSLATLAIGDAVFSSVKFTGTLFVDTYVDDDVVGFIFNYQDNKNFYLVSSSKQGSGQGTWSLKRVNSNTGHPSNELQRALFAYRSTISADVAGQTKYWKLGNQGWESKIPNSWTVEVDDQPNAQSIHIEVWAGTTMVVNKTIVDTDTGRLAGGRLGVYCQSQEQVVWAKMSTQCL